MLQSMTCFLKPLSAQQYGSIVSLEYFLLYTMVGWQISFKDWNRASPGRLHRLWRRHLRLLLLSPGGNYFNLCYLAVLRCRGSACKEFLSREP